MPNNYFQFKQFKIEQAQNAMKVTTDSCLFGAWVADEVAKHQHSQLSGLDVGTGTGLLTLMLVQKNAHLHIDAVEIDMASAEEASKNISQSPWSKNITVIATDALHFDNDKKYDIIISNPPFYENDLKGDNEKNNNAHHSASLTLNQLIQFAAKKLSNDGHLYLLFPYKRKDEAINTLVQFGLSISAIVYVKQSTEHEIFRIMIKACFKTADTNTYHESTIAIKTAKEVQKPADYTAEFITLLKDYYLYL